MWISRRSEEANESPSSSSELVDGCPNMSLELVDRSPNKSLELVDGSPSMSLELVDGCPSMSLELVDGSPSMSSLPLELVDTILSFLSEPSSQLQASQIVATVTKFNHKYFLW